MLPIARIALLSLALSITAEAQTVRTVPSRPSIPPPSTRAAGLGALPGVVGWNLRSFWFDPKFQSECSAAIEKARAELAPGERRSVACLYRESTIVGGETIKEFIRLVRSDEDQLSREGARLSQTFELTGRGLHLLFPPEPFSPEELAEVKKLEPELIPEHVTYEDHVYSTNFMAHLSGYPSDTLDGAEVLTQCRMKDLPKRAIRVPNDATVILISRADEATYRVFDTSAKKADSGAYKKREVLKGAGNVVYLLVQPDEEHEYTIALRGLPDIAVELGPVRVGTRVCSKFEHNQPVALGIHRVTTKKGYFLSGSQGKDWRTILDLTGDPKASTKGEKN